MKERLIATAVRPFDDDAELKQASADVLREMVRDDNALAEPAIQRWDRTDARRWKSVWRIALFVLLFAAVEVVVTRDSREAVRYWKWRK